MEFVISRIFNNAPLDYVRPENCQFNRTIDDVAMEITVRQFNNAVKEVLKVEQKNQK
jgi:hypothetical protein